MIRPIINALMIPVTVIVLLGPVDARVRSRACL
jgi:hypothetical protein